jgi:hypothetical protein
MHLFFQCAFCDQGTKTEGVTKSSFVKVFLKQNYNTWNPYAYGSSSGSIVMVLYPYIFAHPSTLGTIAALPATVVSFSTRPVNLEPIILS